MQTVMKGIGQITLFCLLSLMLNYLVEQLHVPLPGSIIGIFIVFFLLQKKVLRLEWIELGANLLLAELLLFFIPSAVGIVKYKQLIVSNAPRLLLVIVLGTIIVMACAGLAATKISQARSKQ